MSAQRVNTTDEFEVEVHIYDVTKGLAKSMSAMILGRQIEGVWHTGVVVYGEEFTFGGSGIMSNPPCRTILGPPDTIHRASRTQIPRELFMDYLQELGSTTFRPECYNLLKWNCNTFSNEVVNFLTGQSIPAYILSLPEEVLNTPGGGAIMQFMNSMMNPPNTDFGGNALFPSNSHNQTAAGTSAPMDRTKSASVRTPAAFPAAKSEGQVAEPRTTTHSAGAAATGSKMRSLDLEAPTIRAYTDSSVLDIYKEIRQSPATVLPSPADTQILDEVAEYLLIDGRSADWGLAPAHIRVLVDTTLNTQFSTTFRQVSARLLQAALTRDDVVGLCVNHPSQNLARLIRAYEVIEDEQLIVIIAKCVCNCLATSITTDWYLALNESGQSERGLLASQFSAHCLLLGSADARETGARLAVRLVQDQKMSEDIALNLGVALIDAVQHESDAETENCLHYSLYGCIVRNTDVGDIAKATGLHPASDEPRSNTSKYTAALYSLL